MLFESFEESTLLCFAGGLISINNHTSHNNANASPQQLCVGLFTGSLTRNWVKICILSRLHAAAGFSFSGGARPPLPAGCISLPHALDLMRFSFDFSCPGGRGGEENFLGLKKKKKPQQKKKDVGVRCHFKQWV